MGDLSVRVDIQKLLSFGDDLIGVLNNEKDVESLKQSMEGGKMLGAATQGDAQQVQASLEGEISVLYIVTLPHLLNERVSVVVDRNMKRAEKFELDNDLPSYETSNRLWEMASSG
ncbi:uncharacterized protein A4U43_C06F3500 [Asparagus officinalis]|uniref:Uncharacterized protein n=1 Tax=Asparagus officinalis TaxID=4686 RepID=A0A5P1EJ96_ASPOF|nr:uncharacterized protein A4U43_C06F3500 [Asparagus officinalis]